MSVQLCTEGQGTGPAGTALMEETNPSTNIHTPGDRSVAVVWVRPVSKVPGSAFLKAGNVYKKHKLTKAGQLQLPGGRFQGLALDADQLPTKSPFLFLPLQKGWAAPSAWLHLSSRVGQTVLPLRAKPRCWALRCYSQKQKRARMPSHAMSQLPLLQAGGWPWAQSDTPRGEMGCFLRKAGSRQAACQQHFLGRCKSSQRWGGLVCRVCVCPFPGRLANSSEEFAFMCVYWVLFWPGTSLSKLKQLPGYGYLKWAEEDESGGKAESRTSTMVHSQAYILFCCFVWGFLLVCFCLVCVWLFVVSLLLLVFACLFCLFVCFYFFGVFLQIRYSLVPPRG